ncbi:Uma2 family endonuclease [Oscillatoria sp. FACHB-1406]|uniref:Uma2 family endonuclease n=1 Tax=Oscillatoria sp. FACHB-1406 TaxID=2692846 RepID=UPI001684FF71|nr:Uma2 family endonuclease [Oscillatoria sp. FACHB-1406]MBD2579895.1 Uma2 family endonuclease [Oscillatoria sp. FACHB-1406]
MIANLQNYPRMTPEEYLEWEVHQELRYEYIDEEILAMTGGTIPHNDIDLNLYTALRPHLRELGCRVNVSDVKVKAGKKNRYFYPDLVVTCNADDLKARDFIQNPTVIVEVLSPSTANYDRTKKLQCYRQIPSLQEYVLIDSEAMSVEIYRRGEGKMWLYCAYEAGEAIAIDSIKFECAIELLYEGVSFEVQADEESSSS